MIARSQYRLTAADMELVLALARSGTLAAAGERLGVDASTVFRAVQRIEKGLGQRLFERSRSGYRPTDLGLTLTAHGERVEAEIDAARAAVLDDSKSVTGTVRLTTTDTVLHALVLPALGGLAANHPHLTFELTATHELASLARRDADIAVRATQRPPGHLIGRHLGPIRIAVYAPKASRLRSVDDLARSGTAWVAPDDALPEHPSVEWRKSRFPKVVPRYLVGSIGSVLEAVAAGLGAGIVPLFLAEGRREVRRISDPLDEAETSLWLLTHPESRHLRRIAVVSSWLAEKIALP